MNYTDLKAVMAEFRLGHITRQEMVAAIALWQRPVEIAVAWAEGRVNRYAAAKYHIQHDTVRAAVEAVIR